MNQPNSVAPCSSNPVAAFSHTISTPKMRVVPKAYPEMLAPHPTPPVELKPYESIKNNLQNPEENPWPEVVKLVDQVQQDLRALQTQLRQVNQQINQTMTQAPNTPSGNGELSLLA